MERANLPEETKHFVSVFSTNGLALIRFRQGDTAEVPLTGPDLSAVFLAPVYRR